MKLEAPSKPGFESVVAEFMSRRGFIKSASALGLGAALSGCNSEEVSSTSDANIFAQTESGPVSLPFKELEHGLDAHLAVADGYESQVLLRWGDPIFDGVSAFDPSQVTEAEQLKRFGFNCDFVGFLPLPLGSNNSEHGLLAVNHEYTQSQWMFDGAPKSNKLSESQVEADIVAHGLSVVEIKKVDAVWAPVLGSKYNRRITPLTEMEMSGPASGSDRLKTIISQDGVRTLGTYGNCAGGITPWGTVLTGEENVDEFFWGNPEHTPEKENYERFHMDTRYKNWGEYNERWDLQKNPAEPLHVGWIVEIDPFDPKSKPKKLTALGRCKHEGCNVYINTDQRVVAYTGDDQRFEYIYKFVSRNKFDPNNRKANMELLDEGTLYVAEFKDDGTLHWLPLVFGSGPLTPKNGFHSQADISLDTRKAADLVGATQMDRPEDVDINPVNGHVYAMLTNNSERKASDLNAANPRPHNEAGQIVEFWPETGDHTEPRFKWDLFILAGDNKKQPALYHPGTSENGWLACPDNCAFDNKGNIWIATDGAEDFGVADGVWASEVSGKHRALPKRFLRTPIGAELCGPFFTPDNENLFVAVQHPAGYSDVDNPDTRWPDFDPNMPPRSSVVVITKKGGGIIGA